MSDNLFEPTLRQQLQILLPMLRGPVTRAALARRLGITRQSLMRIEEGAISLSRLDDLAQHYGVRFRIVADDPRGMTWDITAPDGFTWNLDTPSRGDEPCCAAHTCAPGLQDLLAPQHAG